MTKLLSEIIRYQIPVTWSIIPGMLPLLSWLLVSIISELRWKNMYLTLY